MATLVNTIANLIGAPVDDKTGLAGTFDYQLDLTPEPAREPDRMDIALQALDRIGLKLDARQGYNRGPGRRSRRKAFTELSEPATRISFPGTVHDNDVNWSTSHPKMTDPRRGVVLKAGFLLVID